MDSSSPSNTKRRLIGSRPRVARTASAAWMSIAQTALVVARAAGEDATVLDDGLERRPAPLVERIDRLDVVVGVGDRGRRALGMQPVGVDDRMAAGLGHLDVLEPGRPQVIGEPLGRARAVGARAPAARRCSGCAAGRGTRPAGAPSVEVELGVSRSIAGDVAVMVPPTTDGGPDGPPSDGSVVACGSGWAGRRRR